MDPILQALVQGGVMGAWLAYQLVVNTRLDNKLTEKDKQIAELQEKRIEASNKAIETVHAVKDVLDNAVEAMRESARLMTAQMRGASHGP